MAYLVSHPDEVKVVSKRFGLGATNLDRYLELDGYKALQKAISMAPDVIINEVKAVNAVICFVTLARSRMIEWLERPNNWADHQSRRFPLYDLWSS